MTIYHGENGNKVTVGQLIEILSTVPKDAILTFSQSNVTIWENPVKL